MIDEARIRRAIHNGKPITCSADEYNQVRQLLHQIAGEYADINDTVRMVIALNEVKTLDRKFEYSI